jgi:hypothetical protein
MPDFSCLGKQIAIAMLILFRLTHGIGSSAVKRESEKYYGPGRKKNLSCGPQVKKNRSKNFGCLFSLYSLIQMVGHSDHR